MHHIPEHLRPYSYVVVIIDNDSSVTATAPCSGSGSGSDGGGSAGIGQVNAERIVAVNGVAVGEHALEHAHVPGVNASTYSTTTSPKLCNIQLKLCRVKY